MRLHEFAYVHVILVQVLNPHLSAGREIGKSVVLLSSVSPLKQWSLEASSCLLKLKCIGDSGTRKLDKQPERL